MVTPAGSEIVLRNCDGFDELDACIQLQIDTWGYADGDVMPRRLFVVAQRIGGQVVGAFAQRELVGFAISLPGVRAPKAPDQQPMAYLHSHMLAVAPGYRNAGIGRRLKLLQREEALSRGILLMEWTFDPVEIKNSYLNIHRLGVLVRSYTPDFYGVSSSRLQGGLPTDRLHAEWWMASERVKAILHGSPYTPPEIQETIIVPKAMGAWKGSSAGVSRALEVQAGNRRCFLDAFARGLAVTGFRVDSEGNGMFELARLQPPQPGVL
jgi:predicted GNAT superfamily acetyltransferase